MCSSQCRVVLVVLGPAWPSVLANDGPYPGQPRLADPQDHVRIETEQALALAPVDAAGRPTSDLLLIPLWCRARSMPRAGPIAREPARAVRAQWRADSP